MKTQYFIERFVQPKGAVFFITPPEFSTVENPPTKKEALLKAEDFIQWTKENHRLYENAFATVHKVYYGKKKTTTKAIKTLTLKAVI
jgi:hypothetical protein